MKRSTRMSVTATHIPTGLSSTVECCADFGSGDRTPHAVLKAHAMRLLAAKVSAGEKGKPRLVREYDLCDNAEEAKRWLNGDIPIDRGMVE